MYVWIRISGINDYETLGKFLVEVSNTLVSLVKIVKDKSTGLIYVYIGTFSSELTEFTYMKLIQLFNKYNVQFSYSTLIDS